MDIKTMTKEELINLKTEVTLELQNRVRVDYEELINKLVKLITDFETKTGYCVAVEFGNDYEDRATNFIKEMLFYTDEYIEPYE